MACLLIFMVIVFISPYHQICFPIFQISISKAPSSSRPSEESGFLLSSFCDLIAFLFYSTFSRIQILEEALLPFLSGFSPCRLKLITMYIEQRRAKDHGAAIDKERMSQIARSMGRPDILGGVSSSPVIFRPIR